MPSSNPRPASSHSGQQRLPRTLRAIQPVTVRPDECALAVGVAQRRHHLAGLRIQFVEAAAYLLQRRRGQAPYLRQCLEVRGIAAKHLCDAVQLLSHYLGAAQQSIAQCLDIGEFPRQILHQANHRRAVRQSERDGSLGKCVLNLLAARRVVRHLEQGFRIEMLSIAAGTRVQPRHQPPLQSRIGNPQMDGVRFPARLAAQDLGRQWVTDSQPRDEVQRLHDQIKHPSVIRGILDAEFPL